MARIATTTDAAEVARLLDAFQTEYDEHTPGAEILERRVIDHIDREISVFLLAGEPDTGVAQLRFREYLHTGEPTAYLEELYVVPERRREGNGRALMELAFEVCRDRGATDIDLNTSLSDTAARGLYEALGFTNVEVPGDPQSQMLYYERSL